MLVEDEDSRTDEDDNAIEKPRDYKVVGIDSSDTSKNEGVEDVTMATESFRKHARRSYAGDETD
jgi:hypothetical protein